MYLVQRCCLTLPLLLLLLLLLPLFRYHHHHPRRQYWLQGRVCVTSVLVGRLLTLSAFSFKFVFKLLRRPR